MQRTLTSVAVAAVYCALWAEAIYSDNWNWTLGHPWLVILGVHVLVGAALATWWALTLPLVPFALAIPASDWNCDGGFECIGEPLALYILVGSLFIGIPCVAIGVAISARLHSGEKNSSRLPSGS